jgi:hypothetical protein
MKILDQLQAKRKSRRRDREKAERLTGADVLVVSHGKSGRTWLRTLISNLYHQKYGIPESQLINYDNFTVQAPDIPKISFMGRVARPVTPASDQVVRLSPEQKLILLLRDPRDIAVSFYFQLTKRATPVEKLRKGIDDGIAGLPIFDFVLDERLGLPRIIERMNQWERDIEGLPHQLRIKYEELHAAPVATLRRVADFIGGGFTDDQIERAIAFGSFDSLRAKEQQGFFDSERLQPADADDPESFKVRRGKVGGYKDYFESEQLEAIDDLIRARLSPSYDYHEAATP